jgi:hypothetical protein
MSKGWLHCPQKPPQYLPSLTHSGNHQ